jgi:uncharacterized phiE125 gp8 family phage protein
MALNSNALTTLANAKAWLKIPTLETGTDSMVEMFINAASDDVEQYTQRKLKAQSHTETHHGRGSNAIMCLEFPLNSVTELRIDWEATFTDPSTLIDPDRYRIEASSGCVFLRNQSFPKGYNNIRVIYNAGYATIPSGLEQAVLWIVAFNHRIWETKNIARPSKSKDGESASFGQAWPDHIMAALNKFKRTEFPNLDAPIWNV